MSYPRISIFDLVFGGRGWAGFLNTINSALSAEGTSLTITHRGCTVRCARKILVRDCPPEKLGEAVEKALRARIAAMERDLSRLNQP
jgi:hypothetical protein